MLGTILYAALDVSLNATIWVIKTTSNGIYYGVNYLLVQYLTFSPLSLLIV